MQAEGAPRSHFFDDDDTSIDFQFERVNEKHQKDIELPIILKDSLTIKSNSAESDKTSVYTFNSKLLSQYKEEADSVPEMVLDLSHSRLKYLSPEEKNPDYGFSISKNGNCYEFYCQDKQTAETWYEALKKICILTSFHDDYKAIKMIGRGSFAKVYLVESKETGKSFAVKAFTKDCMAVSNKANAKPSMLNEIGLMRTIDHENIIKLYEVYETEKSIYLVLELIQGKSLYDVLKKSSREDLTPTKIINMVRSLLDALAYLASKGIMHRDLKPDNILLDKGEKVKLVDFGLATVIDVPNYIFKKCGTPGYIAPEVFKYDDKDPNTNYDDRCDVFSVGCLLYYMLFNTPFFGGATAADILKLNRKFAADFPVLNTIKLELKDSNSKLPKDGLNLLLDLLEFDLKKRISSAQALDHPYFIPVPAGMQKVAGTNEFYIDALSKFTENDIYSPCSPLKLTSLAQDTVYSPLTPLTPLRLEPLGGESPTLPNRDRFVREDSLYLDLGKPEINGRMDTITSGSTNNSLLLANRTDSSNNVGSPCLSTFGNRSLNRANSKTFKSHNQGAGNSSFLKAAIFRNMQKNNSESLKEEEIMKNRLADLQSPKNITDLSPSKTTEASDIPKINLGFQTRNEENEESGTHANQNARLQFSEKLHLITNAKFPTKAANPKPKKFQPFAPGNLNIPKTQQANDV